MMGITVHEGTKLSLPIKMISYPNRCNNIKRRSEKNMKISQS